MRFHIRHCWHFRCGFYRPEEGHGSKFPSSGLKQIQLQECCRCPRFHLIRLGGTYAPEELSSGVRVYEGSLDQASLRKQLILWGAEST